MLQGTRDQLNSLSQAEGKPRAETSEQLKVNQSLVSKRKM